MSIFLSFFLFYFLIFPLLLFVYSYFQYHLHLVDRCKINLSGNVTAVSRANGQFGEFSKWNIVLPFTHFFSWQIATDLC